MSARGARRAATWDLTAAGLLVLAMARCSRPVRSTHAAAKAVAARLCIRIEFMG